MRGFGLVALMMGLAGVGLAQTTTVAPAVLTESGSGIAFGSVGGGFLSRAVKGMPYSLVETITTKRVLTDGTTISNASEERVARDSEGRERREISVMKDGKPEIMSIFLMDPVAHTSTVVIPKIKTAHVNHLQAPKEPTPEQEAKTAELRAKADSARKVHPDQPNMEELGTQVIAGVVAEGRRHTMIFPAGKIGNDREIKAVTETWFSTELKVPVGSTTDDPRFGKRTMVVTELQRTEPAAALFTVPADYKVEPRSIGPAGMAAMGGSVK